MSQHFSASQFDHAFKPIRLNVYTPFTNMPCPPHGTHAMCLPGRCSPTKIIADHNGRLFDCIERGDSSPWGDYSTTTMDSSYDCCCVPQFRRPEESCCEPIPQNQKCIFVSKHPPKTKNKCKVPCACVTIRIGNRGSSSSGGRKLPEKLKQILTNKEKRANRKQAQIVKKQEIEMRYILKIDQIVAKHTRPRECIDLNCVKKRPVYHPPIKNRPVCPPLNSCCFSCPEAGSFGSPQPGKAVTCRCLNNDMYIRRF